jgi:glycosyltransferase involved in cell wall biosynthesis
VTYPSLFEGFGNAFLEAVYYRKPIVVNTYSIYTKDIRPKGFSAIELDGYVTRASIEKTRKVLEDSELRKSMVEQNYDVAKRFFSYSFLKRRLKSYMIEHTWFNS